MALGSDHVDVLDSKSRKPLFNTGVVTDFKECCQMIAYLVTHCRVLLFRFLMAVLEWLYRPSWMYLYLQVLHDLVSSCEKPGGALVTAMQTRYGQVAKQVADKREQTVEQRNRVTYHVVPTAIWPRDRGQSSLPLPSRW
jgi:hypothetical protein